MQAAYLANQDPEYTAEEVEAKTVATLDLKELSAYSKTLIEGVIAKREELEQDLESHLKNGWHLNRVNQGFSSGITSLPKALAALFNGKRASLITPNVLSEYLSYSFWASS